jgi:hypothetical protein
MAVRAGAPSSQQTQEGDMGEGFFTFPHFRPVILNPTTGEVADNSPF